ncbi:helix-turn-helix domain-containing protein [Shewanella japonica]|uniref:helix-turn-helix domain-containing protein n=1 Tax=Shewanella japonica TaxID=93973 RepID=UPI000E76A5D7|nr:helix-turn-helix domain-containing protein [Shewanella japonica]
MNNLLLTPAQVSEFLGVTIGTLSVWRCTGRYPLSFIKVGRRVMYRQSDVESFIEGRVYEHTL